MNNGEETRENVSEVASPHSFDKSDGGDESPVSLSRYSSCGESEFERYCSANSVMGTPSVRSSFGTPFNDCLDSEFGSFKSVGCGDDVSFENFSLGGDRKLSSLGKRRVGFRGGRNDENIKTESEFCGLNLYDDNNHKGEHCYGDMDMNNSELIGGDDFELGRNVANMRIRGNGGSEKRRTLVDGQVRNSGMHGKENACCLDSLDVEFNKREREGEEDGTSSRYEHSEGEDSMYNYGSDDEHRSNSYYPRNAEYIQEEKCENENPLLINSSVAFGSNDWNDFELEVGGNALGSLTLEKLQERRELNLGGERSDLAVNSKTVIESPRGYQEEQGHEKADKPAIRENLQDADKSGGTNNHFITTSDVVSFSGESKYFEQAKGKSVANHQVQGVDVSAENSKSSSIPINLPRPPGQRNDVKGNAVADNHVEGAHNVTTDFNNTSASDILELEQELQLEKSPLNIGNEMEEEHGHGGTTDIVRTSDCGHLENQMFGDLKAQLDPFANTSGNQICSDSTSTLRTLCVESSGDCETKLSQPIFGTTMSASNITPASADLVKDHPGVTKRNNPRLNDLYDEVVLEMEEILLDYSESPGARFSQGNQRFQSQLSLPVRDGGSTASISGTDDTYPQTSQPLRIDGVEVVGARQKKGDVSLSERLVGVKKYTVYKIRVWSGKDHWEVERRYRDFFTLYRRLKALSADQGWILPPPWVSVDKESRKMFGNASPDVVTERSILIQECLQSIINSGAFSSLPSALIWFLSPQESLPSSPSSSNALVSESKSFSRGPEVERVSSLGKTISLIVEIRPPKSTKQLLDSQHYACAGCHKHFDDGMTLMRDFVQTLGWGKPRLCDYTGQLYCSSCHANDTAVLPARVLHHWDFTRYPVSQLAKSYLDSVYDQPMLCVSAVNPFLFSKVPALQQVMGIRKRIGTMLPYVRCPFHRSVDKGLGTRGYLVESNDFFALRDLIDLSKGPFAALPVMLENVSRKILEHITEQCLICCDVGVPCCARQACKDPSSLIFPFQEGEIERCKSCEAVFHKQCLTKLTHCSCESPLGVSGSRSSTAQNTNSEMNGSLLGTRTASGLSLSLFSGLFSKGKPQKTDENKDSSNVILMGSLPNTSL